LPPFWVAPLPHIDAAFVDIDAISIRARKLRKVFARGLGRKATSRQALAIMDAAFATAKAEAAAVDVTVSANDYVRLANHARQARAQMAAVLHAKRLDEAETALAAYLAEASA
jgi:hypothetical protein